MTPVWLDQENRGDSQFSVPAGRSVRTWSWTSTITGRIGFAGGHAHDGGMSVVLSNATTGQRMRRSVASYGRNPAYRGHIESMSTRGWDRIGTARKGRGGAIVTTYDTPSPLDRAMGVAIAFVYETDDLDGGSPAPPSLTDTPDNDSPGAAAHHGH